MGCCSINTNRNIFLLNWIHHIINQILLIVSTICAFRVLNPCQKSLATQCIVNDWQIMANNTNIREAKMDGVINTVKYKVNKIVIEVTIVHLITFFIHKIVSFMQRRTWTRCIFFVHITENSLLFIIFLTPQVSKLSSAIDCEEGIYFSFYYLTWFKFKHWLWTHIGSRGISFKSITVLIYICLNQKYLLNKITKKMLNAN